MPDTDDDFTSFIEIDDKPSSAKHRQPIPVVPAQDSRDPFARIGGLTPQEFHASPSQLQAAREMPRAMLADSPSYVLPVEPFPAEPFPTDHSTLPEARLANMALADKLTNMSGTVAGIGIPQEVRSLMHIAAESTANAAVQGAGSLAGGQLRGVGFATADGYLTAIANGVPARTHTEYLTILRTRFGKTTADLADIRGPIAETALPVDANPTVHVPTGPSVFDAPRAQRPFAIRADAEATARSAEERAAHELQIRTGKQLVAGAVADGHGVILGWQGRGSLARGAVVKALTDAGFDFAPQAKSARAHAGRSMELATRQGLVVRVQRGAEHPQWSIGAADHQGSIGDRFGTTVLRAILGPDNVLSLQGDHPIRDAIRMDFDARAAAETYTPTDLTEWLGGQLVRRYSAVRIGLGFYVPAKHREAAEKLCRTLARVGYGRDWILPAIPLATSDELRDGIVRGLVGEIEDVLTTLRTERDAAAEDLRTALETHDEHGIPNACGAKRRVMPKGDIGEKRAGTFLVQLREAGKRVAAFSEILGENRLAAARESVRHAIAELESSLGDDHTGISARFDAVWDEIRRDTGGAL